MKPARLTGLIAAVPTPFHPDGALHLGAVETQAAHLLRHGIGKVFVGGSTGECHSLTREERRSLHERWLNVSRGTSLRVVIHVGSNSLEDAAALAAHAEELGAVAVAALAPCYFKPEHAAALVECCARVAGAAPNTPFYYYDIPVLTGLRVSLVEFLQRAEERIPTLAGIKYSNPDLVTCQECLRFREGALDILWGNDETLLAGLALGAAGAVGSTYNFAAPLAERIFEAFAASDMKTARDIQFRLVSLVRILQRHGYLAAAKCLISFLGVEVGPPRLPIAPLRSDQSRELRAELEAGGFFE